MSDQKVNLKIGADTSELQKAFSALINKIQGEADKLKIGGAKGSSEATSIRERTVNKAFVDAQAKQYASIVKSLKEEHALLQQIGREREKINRQEQLANIQKATFAQTQRNAGWGIMGGVSGGGGGAGGTPPGSRGKTDNYFGRGGITSVSGLASFLGIPAGIIGGAVTGIAAGVAAETVRKYVGEASYRARETSASAFNIQGQGGQRIQSFLNGGAGEELLFNPLRQQAARNAEEEMRGRMESSFRIFRRPLQTIFGRAGNGYEAGNQFGLGTGAMKAEIDAQQAQERATEQERQFNALKTGPEGAVRSAVASRFLQNASRDLDFQRQMGLSFGGFRGPGGFLPGIQGAGFTDEMGMGMAGSIMGAGGSTRSATGNAALGLQAQRNLDITNAGSILGRLSGGLGSAGTTNESFVKLLAEGTRIGLDGSEYRSENRKFIESAADMIAQSGTTTAGGVDQLLSQFSRFFGDRTMAGMEAGKGAYELYRQTSMAQTGPTGTMRAAGMMSDPTISRLSTFSRASLFNMPIDQLTPDNPAIIAMAAEAGTSPQALIDAQNKVTSRSANKFLGSDRATQALRDAKRKYGVRSAIGFQGPLSQGAYSDMAMALGRSNVMQGIEHPELAQNQRMASDFSDALSSDDAQRQNMALENAKRQQLGATTTGRPEDEMNRVQAEASRLANQLFLSIKDSIVPAADAAQKFAADINALTAAMRGGDPTKITAAINNMNAHTGNAMPATNQPNAGSPFNGPGVGH